MINGTLLVIPVTGLVTITLYSGVKFGMEVGKPSVSLRLLNCGINWLGETIIPVSVMTLGLAWMGEINPVSLDDIIIVEFVKRECVVAGQLDDDTTVGRPAEVR